MRDMAFFEAIGQIPVVRHEMAFCAPTFYYDVTTITAAFLTPIKQVRARLPSRRMKPLRFTLWHAITAITAYEYRDSDIGPYNELAISFPITLDKPAGIFIGARRELARGPLAYVLHLPVTTEIARVGGIEFFGFPKFLAQIEFMREGDWIHCHLAEADRDILTLSARQLPTRAAGRTRVHSLTMKNGHILRSEFILNLRQMGESSSAEDVRLDLGDHSIANELRQLKLGRLVQLQYLPENQAILTPALESYAA